MVPIFRFSTVYAILTGIVGVNMAKKSASTPMSVSPDEIGHLLPDESSADYHQLRDMMFQEFAPDGLYQRQIVSSLVNIEWDIARHRRLLAAALRSEFRRQAGGVEDRDAPGLVSLRMDNRQEVTFGRAVLIGDQEGLRKLEQMGVTFSEITAAAMLERAETIAYHETRIADLERRRRQLHADLERLQAKPRRQSGIDDAVEVG
jgi:hypothetical protein